MCLSAVLYPGGIAAAYPVSPLLSLATVLRLQVPSGRHFVAWGRWKALQPSSAILWCLRVRCSHLQWNLANSWLENLCQGVLVTGKGQRGGQQHWQQKPRSISDLHHLISSVSISCLATTSPPGPHLPCSTLGKQGLCPTSSA